MRALAGTVRWRLTLWSSLSITLIYVLFAGCVFLAFRHGCIAQSRMRLENVLALVKREVLKTPNRLAAVEEALPACNFYVRDDQRRLYVSTGWAGTGMAAPVQVDSRGYAFLSPRPGQDYVIRDASIRVDGQLWRIGVAEDERQTLENLHRLLLVLLFSVPGILLVSVAGGYFLAGRFLSPIDDMARKARAITAEDLSQRLIVGAKHDEFDRLGRVFNETLDRLEESFEKMRRFTADASHELRTPLAVIRTQGENALKGGGDAAVYEDAIGSMLEEADRMTRLLEGLLTLTRTESGSIALNFDESALGEIASDVVDCLRVLAEEKGQKLVFDEQDTLYVLLDKATFEQALINLIANAIQYTQAGGEITVRVRRCSARGALVEVADTGPGIAVEHRERIFDRFYRIDDARSQGTGGSGLGLAIARWAIRLNGGTVELEAKAGTGSLFRIALPCR
jgi:heavy metal sensor kinase